jgi:23S rRNA G2445 N2-methylase RlmL
LANEATSLDELRKRVSDSGYTPARAHLSLLFSLLAEPEERQAEAVLRSAARLGREAAERALVALPEAKAPARARLAGLVGRVAVTDVGLVPALLSLLADAEPKTRRTSIQALGKLPHEEVRAEVEAALLAHWESEKRVDHRRSIAESLGKRGTTRAEELLATVETDDAELRRIVNKALLRLRRTEHRGALSRIRDDVRPPKTLTVEMHCRLGIEEILAEEAPATWKAKVVERGVVSMVLREPLATFAQVRTALWVGIPLPEIKASDDFGLDIVKILTSDFARTILTAFTEGRVRYRLAFAEGGHQRALVHRVATLVAESAPELFNDPTESPWEVRITRKDGKIRAVLCPKGLVDNRFDYRGADVPAASHPTLAAALARVAGIRGGDVVWDPFVGSGLELIERARLGVYRELIGTDLDAGALAAAKTNLVNAKIGRARLLHEDARKVSLPPLDLVISNPPMGRRVARGEDVGQLLREVLEAAARKLKPGGRIVWLSPLPGVTRRAARELGLAPTYQSMVDMGGFEAELQRFEWHGEQDDEGGDDE